MTAAASEVPHEFDASWIDRAVQRSVRLPAWLSGLILAAVLGLGWLAVHASGGTHTSTPHLFYLPIVLATLPFGLRGSLTTAAVATVLCGPLMPLVVSTGQPQEIGGWLVRGAMFVAVGCVASLALQLRQDTYERQLTTELREALAPSLEPAPGHDPALAELVDRVLDERLLNAVYQPIYSFADGRLLAVEALARFDVEPYRTPDRWFAAAHAAGRGVELELLAIEAAMDGARGLPAEVDLSVNASPASLGEARLHALLRNAGRRVVIEITEHAVIEDYPLLQGSVAQLRALGAKIAVDDAGAGFASLRHVVQLAPDTIKLDMSLTQDLAASPLRRALAGALIEFAHSSGANLVVEGIEEQADLSAWCGLGAYAVQGYLVGRPGPLPAADLSPVVEALHRGRQGPVTRSA